MNKKILFIYLIILATALGGCGIFPGSSNTVQQTLPRSIVVEYQKLLGNYNSEQEVIDFVVANIQAANEKEAEELFYGLATMIEDGHKIDLRFLDSYKNKLVEPSTLAYKQILETEYLQPTFDSNQQILISLKELLNRAQLADNFLKSFPESRAFNKVYNSYYDYVSAAIIGSLNDGENQFLKKGEKKLSPSTLKVYNDFSKKNQDSVTGKLVKSYLQALKKSDYNLNSPEIKKSHRDMDNKLKTLLGSDSQ